MADETNPTEEQKLKSGFKGFISKVGDVISDAASLEVTTFTGDFSYKAKTLINNGVDKMDINNVLKKMTVDNETNLTLIAYSRVSIDSDVNTIVKSKITADDVELLKLHNDMMKSGKESRQEIVKMVLDLVKLF